MPHQIAKLILESAQSAGERSEAVQMALALGMPLVEIEEYLDWLDLIRDSRRSSTNDPWPR